MRRICERIIPHALWPLLRRAAADLEGFAHSAAAYAMSADEGSREGVSEFNV